MARLYGPADGEVAVPPTHSGAPFADVAAATVVSVEDAPELEEPELLACCPKPRLKDWITKRRGKLSSPLTNDVIWL